MLSIFAQKYRGIPSYVKGNCRPSCSKKSVRPSCIKIEPDAPETQKLLIPLVQTIVRSQIFFFGGKFRPLKISKGRAARVGIPVRYDSDREPWPTYTHRTFWAIPRINYDVSVFSQISEQIPKKFIFSDSVRQILLKFW